jgi:hypothetical protein
MVFLSSLAGCAQLTSITVSLSLPRLGTSTSLVKIFPVLAPHFTKNGCAPSVTSWGGYLARLFHIKSRSPLSETLPYTEENPPTKCCGPARVAAGVPAAR